MFPFLIFLMLIIINTNICFCTPRKFKVVEIGNNRFEQGTVHERNRSLNITSTLTISTSDCCKSFNYSEIVNSYSCNFEGSDPLRTN